jgi:hypothetical protein
VKKMRLATVIAGLLAPCAAYLFSSPALAGADAVTCTFSLSAPTMTTANGGAQQVTAALTPTSCDGTARPSNSTVCISSGNSPGNCAIAYGWEVAHVYLGASSAQSVVSTGIGCSNAGNPPSMTCASLGPLGGTK